MTRWILLLFEFGLFLIFNGILCSVPQLFIALFGDIFLRYGIEFSCYGVFIIGENPQKWCHLWVFFPWPPEPKNCFTNGCWKLINWITEWFFAFLTFCAVNQFTLELGFNSIGNSCIGRKEILNTAYELEYHNKVGFCRISHESPRKFCCHYVYYFQNN